ncbi:hypothetical protein LTR66_007178 [Elasticomyces elasticus]|nr:hypothetical protein LTR66_007178 [Elasticomyces elasticus]
MLLPRPSILRCFAPARLSRSTQRTFRSSAHRSATAAGAAATAHSAVPKSDLPWAITAIAVTIPSTWYLLQPSTDSHHGENHAPGEEVHETHEAAEETSTDEPAEEESSDEEASAGDSTESKKDDGGMAGSSEEEQSGRDEILGAGSSDSSDKTGTGASAEKPAPPADKSKPESSKPEAEEAETPENKGSVEGVQFKGRTAAGDEDGKMDDTRKREPDSKGAFKKRIDSGYGKDLGATDDKNASANTTDSGDDDMQAKQKGLSNTVTRHSVDIGRDPEKSKKGDGTPETAKTMGTVDPSSSSV